MLSSLVSPPAAAEPYEGVLEEVAVELVSSFTCDKGSVAQVGMLPIEADEIQLSSKDADRVYETFLAKLVQASKGCFTVIDARSAFQTLEYLGKVGVFGEFGQAQLQRIRRSLASVDFVAQIDIEPTFGGASSFVFRLTNFKTGEAIFRSKRTFNLNSYSKRCEGPSVATLQAIDQSFRAIAEQLKDSPVYLEGAYLENTNIRTQLGFRLQKYMMRVASQENSIIELIDDQNLKERPTRFDGISLSSVRSTLASNSDVSNVVTKANPRLILRFGECGSEGSDVWLKLFLNNDLIGHFVVGDLEPVSDPGNLNDKRTIAEVYNDDQKIRHFGLNVSTNFGQNPALEVGQFLELSVSVEKDSWVYCFYIQSDGVGIQLFPNKYTNPKSLGFVRAGQIIQIPNRTDPDFPDKFELQISDDSLGVEAVSCYALADDATAVVSKQIKGANFKPVPSETMSGLFEFFESASEFPVEKSSVTLSVFPAGSLRQ